MAAHKSAPTPLAILRSKVTKQGSDILALRAAVQDLTSRMAKVEVAVGQRGSGERAPDVERDTTTDEQEGG